MKDSPHITIGKRKGNRIATLTDLTDFSGLLRGEMTADRLVTFVLYLAVVTHVTIDLRSEAGANEAEFKRSCLKSSPLVQSTLLTLPQPDGDYTYKLTASHVFTKKCFTAFCLTYCDTFKAGECEF